MTTKPTRWWDLPAVIFLIIALSSSSLRLQTTNWTEHLGLTQWMIWIGVALGLALGQSRFKTGLSFFFGLIYTLCFVPWSLLTLIKSELWLERLQSLVGRLSIAIGQLASNQPVKDSILVLAFFCLLYWLAAFTAGYQLTRNARPWGGLIAAGIVVLIVDYSFEMFSAPDGGTALSLIFFLFSIILVGRIFYLRSRSDWSRHGQLIESEVGFDISRGAAVTALALVLLAWYSPRIVRAVTPGTAEQRRLATQFQAFRERVSNAVSSLRSQAPVVVESLSESLALGRGTNLSDSVVFTVKPEGGRLIGGRFYWTGRIYDTYRDAQWISTGTRSILFGPNSEPTPYNWQGRREVTVEVSNRISLLGTLYFPSIPLSITRPVSLEAFPSPPGEPDITALISAPPLPAGESYRVRAAISAPTIEMLRASADQPLPDWVVTRYTQLPPDFSPRVANLAVEITQGKETPYDRTVAITDWLRANIRYQPTMPEIPPNTDTMEWLLFDVRQGFCNYYATAEVLMLRSLGIPARMVVGYAQGTWESDPGEYRVLGKDFHAWPEVYFPEIGWVPFEPTAAQPSLTYPNTNSASASSGPGLEIPTPFIPPSPGSIANLDEIQAIAEAQARQRTATTIFSITAGAISLGLLGFAFYRWKKYSLKDLPIPTWFEKTMAQRGLRPPRWLIRWSMRARRTPMERLFARVPELLRAWGEEPALDQTPAEQVKRLSEIVPEIAPYAQALLKEYQLAMYSPHKADLIRARRAAIELRQKGFQLWFQHLLHAD